MSKTKPPAPGLPSFELLGIGATVLDSEAGMGKITGFTRDGWPEVNGTKVEWCLFGYGPSVRVFDPKQRAPEEYRR